MADWDTGCNLLVQIQKTLHWEVLTEHQAFCGSIRKYTVCSVVQETHSTEIYAAISKNFIKMDFFNHSNPFWYNLKEHIAIMSCLYGDNTLQKQGTCLQCPDNLWKHKYKHTLKLFREWSSYIHR